MTASLMQLKDKGKTNLKGFEESDNGDNDSDVDNGDNGAQDEKQS